MCNSTFPLLFSRPATGDLGHPGAIAVQVLPVVYAGFVWCLLELARSRRKCVTLTSTIAHLLITACSAASGMFVWRVFDELECEGNEFEQWRGVAVIAPCVLAVALIPVSTRLPRACIFTGLCVASGSVAADWAIRERAQGRDDAAKPLFSVQTLWCTIALCFAIHLPHRFRTPVSMDRTRLPELDPLA